MKLGDKYHKWVEWNEVEQIYLGKCPDVMTGIHGDDPIQLYAELCDVIEDILQHFVTSGKPLPTPKVRPMQDVA
ncbi:MAG: pilus assembly protein HicB [Deltaproteobacteria bacterium]|nr:MAG: pilus assembly protein HicB [Deltaproteobacteria bacterium]